MSPRRCYCYLLIVFGFAGWNATAQALVLEASGVPKSELMATDEVQIKINEGYAALRAQQAGMAEKAFLEANRLNPTAVEALLGLAMVAQLEGKAEKAREWMARAVSTAPKRPEIHQAEARLYADQGNLDIAATRYRKAISTFPDNSQLRLDLANLYLEKIRKPGEAINVLRDLISRNPNFAAGHLALGLAFSADGKLDESIRALSDAAKLDSSNPFIFHALGLLALRQGAPDRALEAFDKALALRAVARWTRAICSSPLFPAGNSSASVPPPLWSTAASLKRMQPFRGASKRLTLWNQRSARRSRSSKA